MFDIESAALPFEAVKIAMRQDKNGIVLLLSVHPNDLPGALLLAPLGTRYQAVLVELSDQDEPVIPPENMEGKKAVSRAGQLCRNEQFQDWIFEEACSVADGTDPEESAASALCDLIGIESRAELRDNEEARKIFAEISARFVTSVLER